MLELDLTFLPADTESLRTRVRQFLAHNAEFLAAPNSDFATNHDAAFSRRLGGAGWIGMTWPRDYGGQNATYLERYVVTEELLAAGAPVGAHWIADRQTGPLLLNYGSESQRTSYLPAIARGELFCSIGMSEPDSGSDLASIRTTATPAAGGYRVNGTKLWTTYAHRNHLMICLVRTEPPAKNRHAGLSQLIVDLRTDDVQVRPIKNMAGKEEFNEVVFTDTFVPDDRLVGAPGNGWDQVTSELAYERSGPERFLSSFQVFTELVRACGPQPTQSQAVLMGRIAAQLLSLRRLSISVAGMLEQGKDVALEAALVKELGNTLEEAIPELARLVLPADAGTPGYARALTDAILQSPSFTLRGGTKEILRGVIARGLGLR
ncbi:MAG: acyl-CoA dehydrogenase family protein [Pseudomonadota bacterium]